MATAYSSTVTIVVFSGLSLGGVLEVLQETISDSENHLLHFSIQTQGPETQQPGGSGEARTVSGEAIRVIYLNAMVIIFGI